ncbi:MAG: DUF1501 domain-containing protein [Planctomycetota bacterium]|nr:DUF1501 domain-containing protein [Planctomycetota bacterium]MDA1214119.1 DUF1501 domain-containing protein [Planctomycetota bacterium]
MLHRRDAMLRLGTAACGALTLPHLISREQSAAAAQSSASPTARSCIFLFMWGGQPQQDMWDMKPEAPEGIRSPFAPIATSAPGIYLGDQMPQIARHADKLSIVRCSITRRPIMVFRSITH